MANGRRKRTPFNVQLTKEEVIAMNGASTVRKVILERDEFIDGIAEDHTKQIIAVIDLETGTVAFDVVYHIFNAKTARLSKMSLVSKYTDLSWQDALDKFNSITVVKPENGNGQIS